MDPPSCVRPTVRGSCRPPNSQRTEQRRNVYADVSQIGCGMVILVTAVDNSLLKVAFGLKLQHLSLELRNLRRLFGEKSRAVTLPRM
jgi:hypothetical protein